jgi:nitronate monooxygenase
MTTFTERFGVAHPIIQAPMAGAHGVELAIAAAGAGALGSLPCAMLSPEQIRAQIAEFRAAAARPVNVNFFCHATPTEDPTAQARWRARLAPYYRALGVEAATASGPTRRPFDATSCALVEELRPEVVSFHFGLPAAPLVARVKATGALVIASATTVEEARWLEAHGCDAVIAQGLEAGGHRGMFLTRRHDQQVGTFALVPQIVDAVKLPVIAAGGIADVRGVAAAFALGASAVQVGTAFLRCPEATISSAHRAALASARDDATTLTNLFSGGLARGIENRVMRELGPICADAPPFPDAGPAIAPLRAAAEQTGSGDFSPLWSGQAAALAREVSARELVRLLAAGT